MGILLAYVGGCAGINVARGNACPAANAPVFVHHALVRADCQAILPVRRSFVDSRFTMHHLSPTAYLFFMWFSSTDWLK